MTHAEAIAVQEAQFAQDIDALERAYVSGVGIEHWEDIVNTSRTLLFEARADAELAEYLAAEAVA